MTIDDLRRDEWREALRVHEQEIQRLQVEIALLERERREARDVQPLRDSVRVQIELATAQLTRHRIRAELVAARLRSLA